MAVTAEQIKQLARACGFELAGITRAEPSADFERFERWRAAGFAADMRYLTDHRGDVRGDPRQLLAAAQSIVCVGKLYNTPHPHTDANSAGSGWISRYAWGADYHGILREGLNLLAQRIGEAHGESFEWRICVDTAPLLERSYARAAGLGWVGKNTCLINQAQGSWFFLGELLLSIPIAPGTPPPDRCGTCRRCIDACPTTAIVPGGVDGWTIDSGLCISYLTIEKRGAMPGAAGASIGGHIFGCDICQDVCPWNGRAPVTEDARFEPISISRELTELSQIQKDEFRVIFRNSPVWRAKHEGFLRNVAFAMGNSGSGRMLGPLEKLASHPNPVVASAARQAAANLSETF